MAHSSRKIQLNETYKVYSNWLAGAGLVSLLGFMATSGINQNDGPSPARTPAQELATFQVEPGMKVQLVASEPMVQDPVIINFDEDGRLWVVEMRGFMTTEANVVAAESRTSSPIRIPRDPATLMHPEVEGLFPCGEGAGHRQADGGREVQTDHPLQG